MKRHIIIISLLATFVIAVISSCTKDHECFGLDGYDAFILESHININDTKINGIINGFDVLFNIPASTEMTSICPEFKISEGASISPDPKQISDWTVPVTLKVISANKEKKNSYNVIINSQSENIFDSVIELGSQKQVNEFGKNNYTIVGGLHLITSDENDPITDLSPLSSIEEIKTEFTVTETMIETIELPKLRTLGNLDVVSYDLKSVSFPELKTVGGKFRIGNNDSGPMPQPHTSLTSVYIPKLENVGRSFILYLCENLESLDLSSLKFVGEDFIIMGGLIKDLSMIKELKEIQGSLSISMGLETLDGFNLESIRNGLTIDLGSASSLEPLSSLKSVQTIKLVNGTEITSLKGLENSMPMIIDLRGFQKVRSTEFLPISDNLLLLSLSGMDALTELTGFEKIKRITEIMLASCKSLTDITPITNIEEVEYLSLVDLGLTSLPKFKNLSKIKGKLTINLMSQMTDMSNLDNLTEVGALMIYGNPTITSLKGLNNIEKVTNGGIQIAGNSKLTNLDDLSSIKEVNFFHYMDKIEISMNEELSSFCGIKDLLLKYWVQGDKFPRVSISGNKYNPTLEQIQNGECSL